MSTFMKPGQPWLYDDASGDIVGVKDRDGGETIFIKWNPTSTAPAHPATGEPYLRGAPSSGAWMTIPSIFRLRLTGTGTVTIDAKDSLGNITLAVASYTVSGATDQIEFPYAGDNAVAIRATLTGDATCEVI